MFLVWSGLRCRLRVVECLRGMGLRLVWLYVDLVKLREGRGREMSLAMGLVVKVQVGLVVEEVAEMIPKTLGFVGLLRWE